MPYKDICNRFRTVKGIKYVNWALVDGKNTKEARENYKKHKSYQGEDFILMKSPEFYESYDTMIPLHIYKNL